MAAELTGLPKVRALLERMNRKGGLGLDVHGWIASALDELDALATQGAEPESWEAGHRRLEAIIEEIPDDVLNAATDRVINKKRAALQADQAQAGKGE